MPDAGPYTKDIRVNEPFPMAKFPIMSAKDAYGYVLEHAGATLPKRDAVDKRIARQVKTGKIFYTGGGPDVSSKFIKWRLPADSYKQGIITHPDQVGGYPEYKGTPYKDSDNDGMPDSWETKHHLNPESAADAAADRDNDGYTNIEEFLNSVVKE
jgi:hypothetical protein